MQFHAIKPLAPHCIWASTHLYSLASPHFFSLQLMPNNHPPPNEEIVCSGPKLEVKLEAGPRLWPNPVLGIQITKFWFTEKISVLFGLTSNARAANNFIAVLMHFSISANFSNMNFQCLQQIDHIKLKLLRTCWKVFSNQRAWEMLRLVNLRCKTFFKTAAVF